ncbi:hypothetical protein CMsap09_01595 [Clavibacter michiganensis]|uniref:Cyclophilin-like domain-containing protein n=1 Tax=Clavibacter michiganensis TaxID=28447 RepID=A0A251XQR8_9MICO|nr:hypothetical protein CMsap09_01595 [Clavibacter michiganensis]
MRRTLAAATTLTALLALTACSTGPSGADDTAPTSSATPSVTATAEAPTDTAAGTPITITADGQTFTATLNDSQVSQDFIATLPVTLDWYRNAGIEYITELPEPMTETGPFYTDVEAGDLVYYNPMDSITIIYEPTSSVPTLTKMGEITSDLDAFQDLPDDVEMRIELE